MTDSINVNLNNLSDEERGELLALVKKANGSEEFPAYGEKYFVILPYGKIVDTTNDNSDIDRGIIDLGNCFRSREEAKFERERLKVLHRMRKIAGNINIKKEDIKAPQGWRSLQYSSTDKTTPYLIQSTTIDGCFLNASEIIFPNQNSAQRAIDEIGEDTLKKYYFRITE